MAKKHLQVDTDTRQYLEGLESGLLGIRANPRRRVKRSAKPKSLRSPGTSFVYAVRGSGRVKFGKADCPFGRMQHLQIGSPCDLSFVGYARFKRDDVYAVESAVFGVSNRLSIPRRGEWLEVDDGTASYLMGAAISITGVDAMEVHGFAADDDYVCPYDLLRDWSTTGSFNIKPRNWRGTP